MELIKLLAIFIVIIFFIKLKKPLYFSVSLGIIACGFLYRFSLSECLNLVKEGFTDKKTLNLVLAFYTITFIQRMMEKRGHIAAVEQSLDNIFNSKRLNVMIAPFIVGLLPSAGAVLIAAPIVNNSAGEHLEIEEKAFVASYFRHISEAFLPTYSYILLALELGKIDPTKFVVAMIPMIVTLFILGYIFYVKKIPKLDEQREANNRNDDIKNLCISLWPIALTILLILGLKMSVHRAAFIVIIFSIILNRFAVKELLPMFKTSFEVKLISSTVAIMVFSKFLTRSGIINRMPGYFENLPIPSIVIFGLIFVCCTLIAGAQATVALALPLAFATIPNGGLPLMIFIMSIIYITMQISPTHICLAIVTEHFEVSFIELVKKTFPVFISFVLICSFYSYVLSLFKF